MSLQDDNDDKRLPSDEELEATFSQLQSALGSLPDLSDVGRSQAPESVFDGARWIHDWINMDAELAQLTHDSSEHGQLVTLRATNALRQISFSTGTFNIEIEIEPSERGVCMTGTVSPPTVGTVQAVVGGISHSGTLDDLGTFLIDGVNHGVVMAFITMESGTVRLGSFEV